MSGTTTPDRDLLRQLAEHHCALEELRARQYGVMAQMIRGCLAKIDQDPMTVPAVRNAQNSPAVSIARREHKREQAVARLYLLHLATILENNSIEPVRDPDNINQRTTS